MDKDERILLTLSFLENDGLSCITMLIPGLLPTLNCVSFPNPGLIIGEKMSSSGEDAIIYSIFSIPILEIELLCKLDSAKIMSAFSFVLSTLFNDLLSWLILFFFITSITL